MNVISKPKWYVSHITNFDNAALINGLPQFGLHVHTGESYLLQNDKGYIGLIEDNHLAWTAGETDPGLAGLHYAVALLRPKFIDRAFHHNTLLVAEENYVYKMDIATHEFSRFIDKNDAGIIDMGNCVFDKNDNIWINDIKGCRVYHFDFDGYLIEILGRNEAGFQRGTISFDKVLFNWIYDLRLGADGNLYVLDSKNYAVRRINITEKTVTTICGDGTGGYSGDDGDAIAARLGTRKDEYFDGPWSLAIDERNNIYIGDTQNHAVRIIDSVTNRIDTLLPDPNFDGVLFEKICSMDYHNNTLYIPDWRKDTPRTLVVAELII